jgi:hypothetical protein
MNDRQESTPSKESLALTTHEVARITASEVHQFTLSVTRPVAFALGVAAGFLCSCLFIVLTAPLGLLTPPLALWIVLTISGGGGIIGGVWFLEVLRVDQVFTTREEVEHKEETARIERAKEMEALKNEVHKHALERYTDQLSVVEQMSEQMRSNGVAGKLIEDVAEPLRISAQREYEITMASVEKRSIPATKADTPRSLST